MSFVGLRGASPFSWFVGTLLGVGHLAVVVASLAIAASGSRDAQWQLIFVPLALLDLPVALLAYPIGVLAARALETHRFPIDSAFVIVAVANGLVGTAFYLLISPAVSAYRNSRTAPPGPVDSVV